MKKLLLVIIVVLLGFQYRLWIGDGSLADVARLKKEITKQQAENQRLIARNRLLAAEVKSLKFGHDAVEERARTEMGMIKKGETYYMIVDEQ